DDAFAPCASPFTTGVLADGDHSFDIRAVDVAGNADPTPASRSFTVDTTAPDTTIGNGPSGPLAGHTATFTFTAGAATTFECRVDSDAYSQCASPYVTDPLPDGTHTFSVRAIDAAGNTDTTPADWSFTLDNTAPTSTITDGPSNLTTDTTPEFAFSADEPGVQFRCRVDDGPFTDCSSPLTLAALG